MQTSEKSNKAVSSGRRRSRNPKGQPRPYKDGNRWKAPGYVTDSHGNRYVVFGTGSTQLAAQKQLEKNKQKKFASFSINQTPPELLLTSAYLSDWLSRKQLASGLSYKTLKGYESALNRWVIPAIGHLRLHDVHRVHLERILLNVAQNNLSRSLQIQIKSVLEPAFRDAVDDGYLLTSPWSKLRLLPPKQAHPAFHDVKAAKAILNSAASSRFPVRWHLAILYGLRQGEALGLRWSDIDLARETPQIQVQMQLQRQTGKGLVLTKPKTFKSNRTIPLMEKTASQLRALQDVFESSRRTLGSNWNPEGFVFCTPAGTPIDPANDRKAWIGLLDNAEVNYLPLKSARATTATHLNNVSAAFNLLGHSNMGVTSKHYAGNPLESLLESIKAASSKLLN